MPALANITSSLERKGCRYSSKHMRKISKYINNALDECLNVPLFILILVFSFFYFYFF